MDSMHFSTIVEYTAFRLYAETGRVTVKLRKLEIKNFGRFHDKTISFHEGINLIYGENETGKSTIHTFIRSMFFGVKRQRGKAARTDLYHQYEPYQNPGYYAGTLKFESGGKHFRVERIFNRENLRQELICEDDGERLSVEDGDLHMLLGGIGEAVYDNTVSVGQMKSKTDEELERVLRNYMANYQGSQDQETDMGSALASLKMKKKAQEAKKAAAAKNLEEEENQIATQIDYVQDELSHKTELRNETVESYHAERTRLEEDKRSRHAGSSKERRADVGFVVFLVLLLALLPLALFVPKVSVRMSAIAGIAVLAALYLRYKKNRKNTFAPSQEESCGISAERKEEISKLKWKAEDLKDEIQNMEAQLEDLLEKDRDLKKTMTLPTEYDEEIEAITAAMDMIMEIADSMQDVIGERLKGKISEIMCELTDGRYRHVSVQDNFQIELHTEDMVVPLYQASKGTVEQVYFALRMAVMDVLCQEEELPLVLDEVFAMYDEKRMGRALSWLSKNRGQVLLFTCQDREERVLDNLRIPYHKISLPT